VLFSGARVARPGSCDALEGGLLPADQRHDDLAVAGALAVRDDHRVAIEDAGLAQGIPGDLKELAGPGRA
jgi:hypothetical protein